MSDARIASDWKDEADDLFKKGDFEGAISFYDKALELFPRDPDLWNESGLALSELRRYEEAVKSYNAALKHYPREAFIRNNKGLSLDNVGKQWLRLRIGRGPE